MGCTAVPRRLSRARAEPFRLCVVRPGWQTVNVDFFSNKKNSTSLPAFSVRVFLSKTCLGAICDDRGAHCHEIVHANGAGGAGGGAVLLPSSHRVFAITRCDRISYRPLSIYPTVPRAIMRTQYYRDTSAVPQLIDFSRRTLRASPAVEKRSAGDWNYQSLLRNFSRRLKIGVLLPLHEG